MPITNVPFPPKPVAQTTNDFIYVDCVAHRPTNQKDDEVVWLYRFVNDDDFGQYWNWSMKKWAPSVKICPSRRVLDAGWVIITKDEAERRLPEAFEKCAV